MSNESKPAADELDRDDAQRYRRPRRPIEVRRRARWRTAFRAGLHTVLGLTVLALVVGTVFYLHRFARSATVFALAGLESVEVVSAERVTPAAVRERFAGRFHRVVTLSDDLDPNEVAAAYRDGVAVNDDETVVTLQRLAPPSEERAA